MTMWRVRPATPLDWDVIGHLLRLPPDRSGQGAIDLQGLLIAQRVSHDGESAQPAGCVRVRREIGLDRPRYWYHVGCVVHYSAALRLFHQEKTLILGNDLTGAVELTDFAVDEPDEESGIDDILGLLVRAALLLIGRSPRFETERSQASCLVIAEMPGVSDASGCSPFWEGLGRHFYAGDPALAMAQFGRAWLDYVAALLPRHPVTVSLLSEAAQAALGGLASRAFGLRDALQREGLRPGSHVAIDDAGAIYEGHLDLLPTRLAARKRRLQSTRDMQSASPWWVLRPGSTDLWRIQASAVQDDLAIGRDTCRMLGLSEGESVWTLPG